MKQEPCVRCLNLTGVHTQAYYDTISNTQYACCVPCQRKLGLGLYRKRLTVVGTEFWEAW